MDIATLTQYLPSLLHGTWITLALVACSLLVGFTLAIMLTLCVISNTILKPIARTYIFVIRGTPLLVQIFLIYYGVGQSTALHNSIFWVLFKEPFMCAVIALAINSSAYSSEIFIGGFRSVPAGEVEACQALGMSWFLSLRRVLLPRALRIALPAYTNEVVMLVKASSLASTITLLDLMGMTQQIINQTYMTIPFYVVAGIIYLVINTILLWLIPTGKTASFK